jgi:hypothetical protein
LEKPPFQEGFSIRNYPQFPEVMPDRRAGYRRVTEQFASIATRLAWLSRILIAAISRRINGNSLYLDPWSVYLVVRLYVETFSSTSELLVAEKLLELLD